MCRELVGLALCACDHFPKVRDYGSGLELRERFGEFWETHSHSLGRAPSPRTASPQNLPREATPRASSMALAGTSFRTLLPPCAWFPVCGAERVAALELSIHLPWVPASRPLWHRLMAKCTQPLSCSRATRGRKRWRRPGEQKGITTAAVGTKEFRPRGAFAVTEGRCEVSVCAPKDEGPPCPPAHTVGSRRYLHSHAEVHHGDAGVAVPAHVHHGVAAVRGLAFQGGARGTEVVFRLLVGHGGLIGGLCRVQRKAVLLIFARQELNGPDGQHSALWHPRSRKSR